MDFQGFQGIALENHVQYLHVGGKGITCRNLAAGLVAFLKSELEERSLSVISGTTQLNKLDLEALRYPSREELIKTGRELLCGITC